MQTQPIVYETSFKRDVHILNKLSPKPQKCFNEKRAQIQALIKDKQYDLYLSQDYEANKIRIAVSCFKPRYIQGVLVHEEIPITAKASKYFYAAKNAIDKHEKALMDIEQENWEQKRKQQKKEELIEIARAVVFAPFYLTGYFLDNISPKLAKKFEKLLDKLGI